METHSSGSLAPPTGELPPSQSNAAPQLMSISSDSGFVPTLSEAETMPQGFPDSTGDEENLMYKSNLLEYCQKSKLPMPVFQVINEGVPPDSRFKCTVWVFGKSFASPNTFKYRRAAEQDAAKLALEKIELESKDTHIDLCKMISQDKTLCKTMINTFASKIHVKKLKYETVALKEGRSPLFVSSLFFNDTCYKGAARSKKEAEQLAAQTAMLSLLDDPTHAASFSGFVTSKLNLYSGFYKAEDFQKFFSFVNKEGKTTNIAAIKQSASRVVASDNLPKVINSEVKIEEQGSSGALSNKQSDSEAMVSENTPEKMNTETKIDEQILLGALDGKQDSSGASNAPVTIISTEPAPLTTTLCPETVPSASKKRRRGKKRNSKTPVSVISTEPATLTTTPCPETIPSASKKRRRGKKKNNKAPVSVISTEPAPLASTPGLETVLSASKQGSNMETVLNETSCNAPVAVISTEPVPLGLTPCPETVSSDSKKRKRGKKKKSKASKKLKTENSDNMEAPPVPLVC